MANASTLRNTFNSKPLWCHGMDALGKTQVNLADRGFHPLAGVLAQVRDPPRNLPLAVLLAGGNQVNARMLAQEVLHRVIGVGGIRMRFGLRSKSRGKPRKAVMSATLPGASTISTGCPLPAMSKCTFNP